MKVLYDYQTFNAQQYGGVSNCFVKLIENLPNNIDYEIAVLESDNVHLRESGLVSELSHRRLSERNFISKKNYPGKSFLYHALSVLLPQTTSLGRNRLFSINALEKGDFDIFHPTFFHSYFLPHLKGKPYVLTVHDMISEIYWKGKDVVAKRKPELCEKAAHIVAVSEKTKQDLIEILKVPENKVTVIYHGAPDYYTHTEEKPMIEGKYVLYVGLRAHYKSFLLMMKDLLPSLLRHKDIKVVCAGPIFDSEEKKYLHKSKIEDRVIQMSVNDKELMNLYSNALCFIYPSQYEGFGIPILESYAAHCPVLLNHASCFPEIAGDASIYFHLNNESSDLEDVFEHFLNSYNSIRGDLIERQDIRLSHFSWKKSAQLLAEVYASIV